MALVDILTDFLPDEVDKFLLGGEAPPSKQETTTEHKTLLANSAQEIEQNPAHEQTNKQSDQITQNCNKVCNKMQGLKLVFYSLLMGVVVLSGLLAKNHTNYGVIYFLSVIAFAGILSTT